MNRINPADKTKQKGKAHGFKNCEYGNGKIEGFASKKLKKERISKMDVHSRSKGACNGAQNASNDSSGNCKHESFNHAFKGNKNS